MSCPFKNFSVLLFCVFFLLIGFTAYTNASSIVRGPYLQLGKTNQMTVMWRTESNSVCSVEYGLSTNYLLSRATGPALIHTVTLSNLISNTRYYYRVSCNTSPCEGSFNTFPAGDEPCVFAAIGDTRNNFSNDAHFIRVRNKALTDWQAGYDPLFLLNNGDVVFAADPLTNVTWQQMFDDCATLLRQAPLYIATGNHDLNLFTGEICPGYYENFSFPTNGPTPERIYSFDCGSVHITVGEIHNAVTVSNESYYCPGSPQFTWITNDLARTDKPWKVVMTHCPVFSSGQPYGTWGYKNQQSTNLLKYYMPEFEFYDVNLHIAGHEHMYERCQKSDTTYLTLSTWDDSYPYRFTNFPNTITAAPFGGALFAVTNELMNVTIVRADTNIITTVDTCVITNHVIPEPTPLLILFITLLPLISRSPTSKK